MPESSKFHPTKPRGWLLAFAVAGFAFLAATLVPVQTTTAQSIPTINIQAATDGISVDFFATTPRNVLTFNVRVVGPGRFVFEHRVEDTTLQWIPPYDLADGFYHWEAWVVSADVGARMRNQTPALQARAADHWFDEEFRQTHLATGSFKVVNGLLEAFEPLRPEGEGVSMPRRIAGAILDFLVPSVRAFEEGLSNNFFGTDAGANNTGNNNNSFFGGEAGRENTTGCCNSFFGRNAGRNNTAPGNSFFGHEAGLSNTTGSDNAFFGREAGHSNTTGHNNAFFGRSAGRSNTTGQQNAFFGREAGLSNTTGHSNSFFGREAGLSNTTGIFNAFFGREAGRSNTTGGNNAFFGTAAGFSNTTGSENAFFGRNAGQSNTTGIQNAFFGRSTGFSNTTGIENAFFGFGAGLSNTDEDNNTFIGFRSNGAADVTNATALGHRAQVTQSNSLVLGSINGVNGATANVDVGIGISAPATPLHVRRMDNTAQIRVEDTAAVVGAPPAMFTLQQNGFPRFNMRDNSQTNVSWDFRLSGTAGTTERFTITKVGTGAAEMELDHEGNLSARGTVTATDFLTVSSRALKTGFAPIDGAAVLAGLAALDISQWSYKGDENDRRRIGPMAEDFREIFGLGDGRHIAAGDAYGVLFAAAKALQAENAELRDRLERLEALLLTSM